MESLKDVSDESQKMRGHVESAVRRVGLLWSSWEMMLALDQHRNSEGWKAQELPRKLRVDIFDGGANNSARVKEWGETGKLTVRTLGKLCTVGPYLVKEDCARESGWNTLSWPNQGRTPVKGMDTHTRVCVFAFLYIYICVHLHISSLLLWVRPPKVKVISVWNWCLLSPESCVISKFHHHCFPFESKQSIWRHGRRHMNATSIQNSWLDSRGKVGSTHTGVSSSFVSLELILSTSKQIFLSLSRAWLKVAFWSSTVSDEVFSAEHLELGRVK